jgi:hypothetical protein
MYSYNFTLTDTYVTQAALSVSPFFTLLNLWINRSLLPLLSTSLQLLVQSLIWKPHLLPYRRAGTCGALCTHVSMAIGWSHARCMYIHSLVPRPKPQGGKRVWVLFRFCKLSILTYSSTILMWLCIRSRSNDCTMSPGSLALANENAVLWICIALRSNVGLARDWLHIIGMKSRACKTKKSFQCHQTLPRMGIWGWERDYMCSIYMIDIYGVRDLACTETDDKRGIHASNGDCMPLYHAYTGYRLSLCYRKGVFG